MDVKLNQKFQNRKNGRIAHVERLDEKAKTVILMYDDEKGGYSQNMTFITLGKSYKRVEDEVTVEPATKEANDIARDFEQSGEVAGDGTPYAEVMAEIKHDEAVAVEQTKEKKQKKEKKAADKPKKEKKERKKRVKNDTVDSIVAFIIDCTEKMGGESGVPREEAMMFRALRKSKNGRQFCKLMWSGKSAKLFSKIKLESYPSRVINYQLPNVYEFYDCSAETKNAIKELLTASFGACRDKKSNVKKEED